MNEFVIKVVAFFIFYAFVCVISNIIAHCACYFSRKTGKPICNCWDCNKPCHLWKYGKYYVFSFDYAEDIEDSEYYEYCTFFKNVHTKEIIIVKDSEYTEWLESFEYKNNEFVVLNDEQ